jgi:mannose-1-phosphate guanylyltransferase/mannose-1-phosphate guanylyltransferase/mannose-6-phosphate isomerase
MNNARIVPVVLSGGAGTRLWPMSRPENPKQLLALTAEETMLQLTARRTLDPARFDAPIIVANAAHADAIETQLARAADPGRVLLVMPSDHVITNPGAFRDAIETALPLADDGWLVTFGIEPDAPETGYGYIQTGESIATGAHRVLRFVEKPDRATAEAMLATGGHAWNGGIFLFRADVFLGALSVHAPDMLAAVQAAMRDAEHVGSRIHPHEASFATSPSDSIDYAVMEKAERVAVVPVSMGWSDLGSWDALHALSECDASDNACDGDAILIDSRNCLVRSDGPRVALVGVDDLIVVASGNDILILPRGRSQDVRKVTDHLKERGQ